LLPSISIIQGSIFLPALSDPTIKKNLKHCKNQLLCSSYARKWGSVHTSRRLRTPVVLHDLPPLPFPPSSCPVPREHCRLLTALQLSLRPVSTASPSSRCSVHPASTTIFGPASRELRRPQPRRSSARTAWGLRRRTSLRGHESRSLAAGSRHARIVGPARLRLLRPCRSGRQTARFGRSAPPATFLTCPSLTLDLVRRYNKQKGMMGRRHTLREWCPCQRGKGWPLRLDSDESSERGLPDVGVWRSRMRAHLSLGSG
jgi:hypothetical protein